MANEARAVALETLGKAVERAKRRGNVPFPPSFVRAQPAAPAASLARMIQGGRGGEVRLKIYLCITMMATAPPYDLRQSRTPQTWTRMLALPRDTGPRRITSNMKWLEKNKFIALQPRPGSTPQITLLSAVGDGKPYVRASEQGRYIGMPIELWTRGWLLDLSATALALLFVLMESQGGHKEPRYVPRSRREAYGLSPDTWTRARKELERHGLLTVRRAPQGSDFDYYRLRNTYWVDIARLQHSP